MSETDISQLLKVVYISAIINNVFIIYLIRNDCKCFFLKKALINLYAVKFSL